MRLSYFTLIFTCLTTLTNSAMAQTECRLKAENMIEIAECAQQEKEAIDEQLASLFQEMKKRAIETDKSIPGYAVEKKLKASQESFEKYAEDTCQYESATYTTGSLASSAYAHCKTELLAERIKFFQSRADQ